MAGVAAIWHGNPTQQAALLLAVQHNCTCKRKDGLVRGSCPAHQAMLEQRWLDGLLFGRYLSQRLLVEEFR